ncbi:Fe2+-dependent dioxygenase [Marimonas lutisalis]|uniref:Fe2+-dependent dioxygenase n=1 Tax=Marimonas lutisalis TaxID=2545756 RepID=UPI001375752A|nr:Fe2+-dependent dioxygenase [Marimonas lutisalis]
MPIVLSDVVSAVEARVLHDAAAALPFEDGAKTAGRTARAVKDNQQGKPGPETNAVLDKVKAAMLAHPVLQAVAYPKGFAGMMVTRTEGGGQYGDHVDNALMAGRRTDVSFTLFLSEPGSYDGGALTIADRVEERQFKLGQGEMVVYPSTTLHRVEPVTRGARLVVVGWITSWVRDAGQREVLFDLWQALAGAEAAGDADQVQRISKARSNLLRMWVT